MARSHYFQYLVNEEGQPVEGATIGVYLAGTETCAEIYDDMDGGTSYKTPDDSTLLTDSNGLIEFWVPNTLYPVDTGTIYTSDQLFKVSWSKAGIISGEVDYQQIVYNTDFTSSYIVTSNSSDTTINITTEDVNQILLVDNSSDVTINLPSVDSGNVGVWLEIQKLGSGDITINGADSDAIEDGTSVTNTTATQTWANITLFLATGTKWKFRGAPLGSWTTS